MKRRSLWTTLAALEAAAALALAGCVGAPMLDDGKYEAWNMANNLAYVDNTFVYEVDKLPIEGKNKTSPIPADYWPIYKDNVNQRWDGDSPSPAEKFEKAFNKTGVVKAVTERHGIKAHGRKQCKVDGDCADLKDGSSCALPRGEMMGACIPTWWGICHGWAPYAFSEPPPVKAVTKNGVTFYPGDLEGLMSLAYSSGLQTKFISERCNKKEPGFDNTGRVRDSECRDMNPGTWHVLVTNMLGLRQTGFVYDRTAFDEVWNQPGRDFKVTNAVAGKLKEVTKEEAIKMLGLELNFTEILAETALKKDEKKSGVWTADVAGEVLVKSAGSGDADLFVKLGAEATEQNADCKSTGGTSAEQCKVTVKVGDKVYYLLKGYAADNKASLSLGKSSGMPNYAYNPAAKRFFYVEMDFRYIREARPSRESRVPQIDQYTATDSFTYLLETDDKGRLLGGEWIGASRDKHPDFAWWPVAKPRPSLANGLITYEEVKLLHDESAGVTGGGPVNPMNQPEVKELAKDIKVRYSSNYTTLGVPAGASVTFTMTGSGGNADLFVRLGSKPTIYSFTCKSTGPDSNESCMIKAGPAGGTYYVRVRPVSGEATVTVKATITKP